jgi:diguanylate cyclase (GGDEF)-like protein
VSEATIHDERFANTGSAGRAAAGGPAGPTADAADGGAHSDNRPRSWRRAATSAWPAGDAPLRARVGLIIVAALAAGLMIGMAEAHAGHPGWVLALGAAVAGAGLFAAGRAWLCQPIEHLARRAAALNRQHRPGVPDDLPVGRRDEVGQIARVFQRLSESALRDYHEARSLRRNIDHRVAEATERATRQLARLVMRDPLTDLGNRRFLDEQLGPLAQGCRNGDTDLVCVAIDLDDFKNVNDTLGHAAGDELLRKLAQIIRGSVRRDDYPIRLGGDEFLVLMPGCTPVKARRLFEQVAALFAQHVRAALPDGVQPAVSAGIASLRHDGVGGGPELIEAADRRLYDAKRQGKGRIVG